MNTDTLKCIKDCVLVVTLFAGFMAIMLLNARVSDIETRQSQDRADALHNKETVERLWMQGGNKKAAQESAEARISRGELPGVRP